MPMRNSHQAPSSHSAAIINAITHAGSGEDGIKKAFTSNLPSAVDLSFEVLNSDMNTATYSKGCTSGGSSGCCTAICSGGCKKTSANSLEAWEQYLEINAGILQY